MHKYSARSDKDKFLKDEPVTRFDEKREKDVRNVKENIAKELEELKKVYSEVLKDIAKIKLMLTKYEMFKPLNHKALNSKIEAKKIAENTFDRDIAYLFKETFLNNNLLEKGLIESLTKIRLISIKSSYKHIEQNNALDWTEIGYQKGLKKLPKKKSSLSTHLYALADEVYKMAAKEDSDPYFDEDNLSVKVDSNNVNINPELAARKIQAYNTLVAEFKSQFIKLINGLKNLGTVIIELNNSKLEDATWKLGKEAIDDINSFKESRAKDTLSKMCELYNEFILDKVHEKEDKYHFRKDTIKQRKNFGRQKKDTLEQAEKAKKPFSGLFKRKGK